MTRRLLAVAAALLIPSLASAEPWTVVAEESELGFEARQGETPFTGVFDDWSAEILFDPAALGQSKAVAIIDMASARTGDTNRDGALPGREWFAIAMFPEARFETETFRHLGDDAYEADATLTIKGVSRPVTLPFTLTIEGDVAKMEGALEILRTQYKIGEGQWAKPDTVALEVVITVDLVARRGKSNAVRRRQPR